MKTNSTIEQLKCEGYEKRDRLLVLKLEFHLHIAQQSVHDWSVGYVLDLKNALL